MFLSNDIIQEIYQYLPLFSFYNLIKTSQELYLKINKTIYFEIQFRNKYTLEQATRYHWLDYIKYNLHYKNHIYLDIHQGIKYSIIFNKIEIFQEYFIRIEDYNNIDIVELIHISIIYNTSIILKDLLSFIERKKLPIHKIFNSNSFIYSIQKNNIYIVEYHILNNITNEYAIDYACLSNNFEMVKLLLEYNFTISQNTLSIVIQQNNFELFTYIEHYTNNNDPRNLFSNVCLNCYHNFKFIKYIGDNYKYSVLRTKLYHDLNLLIEEDNPLLVKYLYDLDFTFTTSILNKQCKLGNYYNIKELIQLQCQPDINTLPNAIIGDNLEMITYLLHLDLEIMNHTITQSLYIATKYKNESIIKLLNQYL